MRSPTRSTAYHPLGNRYFNSLEEHSDGVLIKRSEHSLQGEIHWYRHIHNEVVDLFPKMYDFDSHHYRWYTLERIEDSIPLSRLLASGGLDTSGLLKVLQCLSRIHSCQIPEGCFDIYENYLPKLLKRKNEIDYSIYPDSEAIFADLHTWLNEYKARDLGIPSIIHGDPVFTNLLITGTKRCVFLDMRGQLGERYTVVGDRHYDYAKVYQSLLGYDHLLLGVRDQANNLEQLRESFLAWNTDETRPWIKVLSMSLLYTLIPLHRDRDCGDFWQLLQDLWVASRDEVFHLLQ